MSEFRLISNHAAVIRKIGDLQAGITQVGVTVSREAAEAVAGAMRAVGHVRTGKTVGSIALQPLNQYATRVVAGYGAPWEERRGGDHALLTRAVEAVEPQALQRFTQLGLDAVRAIGG
jgi:hypothetical protein